MSPESTKQHIYLSTINAIEKHGLANLTTRLIADEAGVNNAALHYYYGTKEQLIDIVLDQTAKHMLDDTREILSCEAPIEMRLKDVLSYVINGVIDFPNLIRAQLTGPLFYANRKEDLVGLLGTWVRLMREAIAPDEDPETVGELNQKLNMIFSGILISGLFNNSPGSEGRLNLQDPEEQESFINLAIHILLDG